MRSLRQLSLPLLALITAPSLRGQAFSPRAIADINHAPLVHVQLTAGTRGTLVNPQADSLSLRYGQSHVRNRGGSIVELAAPLPVADVLEIQRPIGTNAGKGARIGGIVGASLAVLAVIAASGDEWTAPTAGQSVAAIGVWTLLGAGVGSLIGNGSTRWETIYRAP
jgi:hypothetical protein